MKKINPVRTINRHKALHSFAVLAYKRSDYLEKCLLSLKNQKLRSNVYITTSTPSSFISAMAKKYGVPLFVNPKCEGIAGDWNFALKKCRSSFLTLAHQDDLYDSDYSEQMTALASRHPDFLIAFPDHHEIDSQDKRRSSLNIHLKRMLLALFFMMREVVKTEKEKRSIFKLGNPISCPSVLFNMRKLGKFQFRDSFKINLDWEAWITLSATEGPFLHLKKDFMAHRIHAQSTTSSGLKANVKQAEDLELFKRLWPRPIAYLIAALYRLSYISNG